MESVSWLPADVEHVNLLKVSFARVDACGEDNGCEY